MFNRPSRSGLALALGRKVTTKRFLLALLIALLVAVTLVFAIVGPVLDGAHAVADGDTSTVIAGWSFERGDVFDTGSSFRAGPSWS